MRDPRRFHVAVNGKVTKTAEVLEARLEATKLVLRGERGVRLVNKRTGRSFRWWPELGRAVAP